jgi:hypothetical protein
MDTKGSFLGVERLGRGAHDLPKSNVKVKNAWSYTSAPQYAFMALSSVKKGAGTTLPLPLHFYLIMFGGEYKL